MFQFVSMKFRGKNSLPLTPKTVHLLRLPRTIGKRKGDDNKFFPRILAANHQSLTTTLNSHSQDRPSIGCAFFELRNKSFVPAMKQVTVQATVRVQCQIASPLQDE